MNNTTIEIGMLFLSEGRREWFGSMLFKIYKFSKRKSIASINNVFSNIPFSKILPQMLW
jgi:hypothetical protein